MVFGTEIGVKFQDGVEVRVRVRVKFWDEQVGFRETGLGLESGFET